MSFGRTLKGPKNSRSAGSMEMPAVPTSRVCRPSGSSAGSAGAPKYWRAYTGPQNTYALAPRACYACRALESRTQLPQGRAACVKQGLACGRQARHQHLRPLGRHRHQRGQEL